MLKLNRFGRQIHHTLSAPCIVSQTLSKAAAAIKPATADLTAEQAISALWAVAVLGYLDQKDLLTGLFNAAATAIAAAPDSVSIPYLGRLCEAQTIVLDRMGGNAPKLPDQVRPLGFLSKS